ncbi:hypothetical protein BDW42DRAFT_201860 [Aspergillus taichungensis]|uniref:Apple domain-containing protein n=1 Tax=Aspergillus taichungensis TaxID=482145 RepID=A0A2J5HP95_9EURO|nr:hypothetical protein BDW42DRAFT_201860 [Aspergillus taichungensis]
MKLTTVASALMLAASVQAQGWLQSALTSCLESEQTCQNKLNNQPTCPTCPDPNNQPACPDPSNQLAYQDIVCPTQSGVFRAAGDELWRVWCDQKSQRGSEISVVSATSNHDCLDKCDRVRVCSSGDYEVATGRCRLVEGGVKVVGPFYDGYRVPAPGFIAFNHVGRLDKVL